LTKYTNYTGISLPLAVWLAADDYDFDPKGKSISVTALLKSPRQILLRERITEKDITPPDIADRIAPRLGHAVHDSIEKAWLKDYRKAMGLLGYPDKLIDRIRINPNPDDLKEDDIPVYLEIRGSRKLGNYTLSGKFDQCIDGELNDTKTTSVYAYMKDSKADDFILQGSLYRWIHQDIVTSDTMTINYVFTDWSRGFAKSRPGYPENRVASVEYELMSLKETEAWIRNKIKFLEENADKSEQELPYCTDKELWRSEPEWKYYSNPAKTDGRSTKNFDNAREAYAHKAKAGKGVIIEVPGKVKACSYCPVFDICTQKDMYDHG